MDVFHENNKKIILDLCGGTGAWSKPYKNVGYDVHVWTLPEHDILEWPLLFTRNGLRHEDIYGILAAPPCTMFSRARSTGPPRDLEAAMKVVQACLELIWTCRSANNRGKKLGGLKFWALENPMGLLRQFLGNPPNSFRGWEYGDQHVKFTDLWGYYNMPTKKYKIVPDFDRKKWAASKAPPQYEDLKLSRADVRAITPPLFCESFYGGE